MLRIEISKVPPPKSNTATCRSAILFQPVGERGCRRLVDQAHDFESGKAPGVLGGLTLAVVEVGGNGDHDALDFLAPSARSAPLLSARRISAEICDGVKMRLPI